MSVKVKRIIIVIAVLLISVITFVFLSHTKSAAQANNSVTAEDVLNGSRKARDK